ncbi:MAG: hypothetical protein GXY88_07610 [Tissierellia bacterium]|nr:hypothetical protein [Tissierellia bacterium]
MISNKYLRDLYEYPDEDTSINQLLELLKSKDMDFINSLYDPLDLEECDEKEIVYLTKVSALIDYYLQLHDMEVPHWLRDERLKFNKPYFHSKKISDFDKVRLQYTNPTPFKERNVFFDLRGIKRF